MTLLMTVKNFFVHSAGNINGIRSQSEDVFGHFQTFFFKLNENYVIYKKRHKTSIFLIKLFNSSME